MEIQFDEKRKKAKLIVNTGSGSNRKRHTRTISYNKKKDAEKEWFIFEQQIAGGIESSMSVANLIEWFIEDGRLTGTKATTLRAYNVAKKPIISYFKGMKASMVTTYHVERFIHAELKYRSAKTIKNEVSLLSAAYKKAQKLNLLKENPCKDASLPKLDKTNVPVLNSDTYDPFVKALFKEEDTDFRVAVSLALFCGLRCSEILALTEEDISLSFHNVSVNKSRHRVNQRDVIQTPKTATSKRIIALPQFLVDDLKLLFEEHKQEPMNEKYIIHNCFGESVSWNWLQKHLNQFLKKNELDHITMHGLRHSHATYLISKGFEVAEVSHQLGHADLSTTLNIYVDAFEDAATASRRAADVFSENLPPFCHPKDNKKAQ